MPRVSTYPYIPPKMLNAMKYEKFKVTCRCGLKGTLKPHMGSYLIIRHGDSTHLVKEEDMPRVFLEVEQQLKERLEGLMAMKELIDSFKKATPVFWGKK